MRKGVLVILLAILALPILCARWIVKGENWIEALREYRDRWGG